MRRFLIVSLLLLLVMVVGCTKDKEEEVAEPITEDLVVEPEPEEEKLVFPLPV